MRLPHRRLASLALLSALTFGPACKTDKPEDGDGGKDKPGDPAKPEDKPRPVQPTVALPEVAPPTVDSAPVSEIGSVIATVQLPTGASMLDLAPVLDSFEAGSSTKLQATAPMMLAGLVGAKSLDGAKLSSPISIIIVDPIAHPKPAALLVEVEDAAKLRAAVSEGGSEIRERDGRALIGPVGVLDAAEEFAFANLGKAPDHSEIVVYPAPLVKALGPKIDEGIASLPATGPTGFEGTVSTVAKLYVGMMKGIADQTDRIVISLSASQSSTDLFFRVYPVAGSTFAAFVAAQTPTDHALLAKLPATASQTLVMSGEFQAGPAKDAIMKFMTDAMASFFPQSQGNWVELFNAWMATTDGRMAMTMKMNVGTPGMAGVQMGGLFGSTDGLAMRAAWRAMMAAMTKAPVMEMMGISMTVGFQEGALEHDGVPIDLYTSNIDTSKLPPESQAAMKATGSASQAMHLAAFDQFGAMAQAEGEGIKAIIDAARGKGETFVPSGGLALAMDASKARGESFMYYIDFSTFMPVGAKAPMPFNAMVMGMGKQGEALSFCMSVRK